MEPEALGREERNRAWAAWLQSAETDAHWSRWASLVCPGCPGQLAPRHPSLVALARDRSALGRWSWRTAMDTLCSVACATIKRGRGAARTGGMIPGADPREMREAEAACGRIALANVS